MRNKCCFLFLWMWGILFVCPVLSAPYFSSLRVDRVNLRTGPGDRFPILWVYQEKNYPVEVLDSFDIWRQIRELDGTIGWVHQTMLSKVRYGLILEDDKLLSKPATGSSVIAVVQSGVLGKIRECPHGIDFCLLQFIVDGSEIKGWFPRRFIYGIGTGEVIE